MDKISVIVPVYNVEKYLDRCVESIVSQTYENLEIILVDDGSLDNCPQMCDDWAKKDERIRVVHKTNGGISSARNRGIDEASGRYLMFIDGDDEILPNMVESMYLHIKKSDSDIARCRMIKVEKTRSYPTREFCSDKSYIELSGMKAMEKLFINEIDCSVCLGLYKNELFCNIRFPLGKTNEDFAVLYKVFCNSKKVVYMSDVFYKYFYRENSITTSRFSIKQFDKYYNCIDMIDYIQTNCPAVLPEARYYLQLQSMYLYKEVMLRGLEKEHFTEYRKIRKTLKREALNIISSKWFSSKEKLSVIVMVYTSDIYKSLHKKEMKI